MSVAEREFRERFAPLSSEPLFEWAVEAFLVCWDGDDEEGEREVQVRLAAIATERGLVLPPWRCTYCGQQKATVRYFGEECNECTYRSWLEQTLGLLRTEKRVVEREMALKSMSAQERKAFLERERAALIFWVDGLLVPRRTVTQHPYVEALDVWLKPVAYMRFAD